MVHTQGPCCSSFDVSAYHDAAASGHMRYIGQTLPSVNHHACWSMIRVREEDGRRRPWKDRVTLSTGRTVGGYNPRTSRYQPVSLPQIMNIHHCIPWYPVPETAIKGSYPRIHECSQIARHPAERHPTAGGSFAQMSTGQ